MSRLEKVCQRLGVRITGQRRLVLSVLEESTDHPSAQEIHRRIAPGRQISLSAVYRTLKSLTEIGIVERHAFGGDEARYEIVSNQHHHLLDETTGEIVEIDDGPLNALLEEIADRRGYHLVDMRVELVGKRKRV